MSKLCTCTKDKEMTCIVHPTDRAMKELIATQQARIEKLLALCRKYDVPYFEQLDTGLEGSSDERHT